MPISRNAFRLHIGRHCEPGRLYLLTAVTHNRNPILRDFTLGRLLVTEFKRAQEQRMATSLAWVIMPDHFHWLIELQEKALGALMCRVKSRSSLTVNQALGGHGRLWQKGYHERAIRHDEDLKALARYIVLNPRRAGLVQRIGDYPLWDAIWL